MYNILKTNKEIYYYMYNITKEFIINFCFYYQSN